MKKPPDKHPCTRATGSYEAHARALHNEAKKAHAEWIASLSEEEREKVRRLNVDSAPDDSTDVGGHSPFSVSDIADSSLAKCEPDMTVIDTPESVIADRFSITPQQAGEILRWHQTEVDTAVRVEKANYLQIIVGGLLSSKNPKINSAGLAFAAKLAALNGLPCQREYARQNHITASAISKVVKAWQRSLGLTPSTHQKSEHACKIYSQVGKTRHWRNKKISAQTATALLSKIRRPATPNAN
jgi:hypothetical protein